MKNYTFKKFYLLILYKYNDKKLQLFICFYINNCKITYLTINVLTTSFNLSP
jgi:hypothetical protein